MPSAAHPRDAVVALARKTCATAAACCALLVATSTASPFVPANDATVLERLPERVGDGRTGPSNRAARAVLARDPKNFDLAVRVAQLYVARARSESDPRLLGQAQAALAPWWSLEEPPVPALLLRATIRQSNHDFTAARRDLEQAVRREPGNAQAWLTLATVQQVTGDLAAAAESCAKLDRLTLSIISRSCLAAVDGLRGRALPAFESLATALESPDAARAPLGVRTWALTLQAELAERLSRTEDAARLYRASLALDPRDSYALAAYSDLLIDLGRPAEVIALIPADTPVDILLLRRAIAARLSSAADARRIEGELGQRFAASRARGDRVHLREEARYALFVKQSPVEALTLARDNWAVQKEPLDARIALEAAIAAKQPKAAAEVLAWIERNQLQGASLQRLSSQVRAL